MPRQQLNILGGYVPSRPSLRLMYAEALTFVRPRSANSICRTLPRLDRWPVLVLPVIDCGDTNTAPKQCWLYELGCGINDLLNVPL